MNNAAELIAEKEAATLARVSTSTLARFAEAGYFQVETSGNDRFYSRRALAAVFGLALEEVSHSVTTATGRENVIPFPQANVKAATEVAVPPSEVPAEVAPEQPLTTDSTEPADELHISSPASLVSEEPRPAADTSKNENFSEILKMHTDILSRQEREIQELRSERDWLRRRIEKLEEKAERDQVLLLSEAQTVKQLIQLQAQKKSSIRQALEWFGIVEEQKFPAEQKMYQSISAQERSEHSSSDRNS